MSFQILNLLTCGSVSGHADLRVISRMKVVASNCARQHTFVFLDLVICANHAKKLLCCVNKWLTCLFFIFQLYFQVSQHKHKDNIHCSVQWEERKTGGPGVPSEACATPDLSLNDKHSRQHGSPDQPSPFSHRNYQVFKPCRWNTGQENGYRIQTIL